MPRPTALHLAALAFGAAVLLAQAPASAQTADAAPPAAEAVSRAQLEAFAAAAVEVQRIGERLLVETHDALDETQAAELTEAARLETEAAVAAQGLTLEEYDAILERSRNDPELQALLAELMRERSG